MHQGCGDEGPRGIATAEKHYGIGPLRRPPHVEPAGQKGQVPRSHDGDENQDCADGCDQPPMVLQRFHGPASPIWTRMAR